MLDVCVVGSANLDLVATTERLPGPGETVHGTAYAEHAGGKGLNQAVAAARAGAAVAFVGAVGDDDAGRRLLAVLDDEGIDRAGVAVSPSTPTGRAVIVVAGDGENTIVVVPGANADVDGATWPDARVVLTQLEVPLAAVRRVLRTARARGARAVLNPAPATPLDRDLLGLVDVVIPNEHEGAVLGGADGLLASGCGVVVTTLGERGAQISAHGTGAHVAAFPVDAVDTTGAGDAFCGVLAARLATGDELAAAVRWAAAGGALAATVAGAVPSMPTWSAIRRLARRT